LKVLHVVPSFYPATYWGGPIYSLYGLCNALAGAGGLKLRVLTTDTGGPSLGERVTMEENPANYAPGYQVYFARRIAGSSISPELILRLWAMLRWADLVHLTGVYSFPTIPTLAMCRVLGKPVVWSPTGSLMRWPGATRRNVKYFWERLCDLLLDPRRTVLQVTSLEEAEVSRKRIRRARVEIVPNGVDLPQLPQSREWRPNGRFRLLYIGRLHPIKGIENLISALSRRQPYPWSLRICGAGDVPFTTRLRDLASDLGIAEQVTFVGHVDGAEKTREFLNADVCILPSHSENFGMTVVESLAHGTPVIASTGTPWKELEARGAGRWVANDPESLAKAIAELQRGDLAAMGLRGREWMSSDYRWPRVAERMADLYRRMLPDARTA